MSALSANKQAEEVFGKSRSKIRISGPIIARAREFWSVKTAAHLAEITGFSQRACEAWLDGSAKIPSDALAALIRSEHGLQFVVAIMGDWRPAWWAWFLRLGVVGGAMRRRAADRRLIEKAMEADDGLAATMARATDALCVQDENFGRVFADGFGAMARAPDRAMAAKRRG